MLFQVLKLPVPANAEKKGKQIGKLSRGRWGLWGGRGGDSTCVGVTVGSVGERHQCNANRSVT